MANVTLVTSPKRLVPRMAFGYSRKKFKNVVDPVRAAANHSGVLIAMGAQAGPESPLASPAGDQRCDRMLVVHGLRVLRGCPAGGRPPQGARRGSLEVE